MAVTTESVGGQARKRRVISQLRAPIGRYAALAAALAAVSLALCPSAGASP